MKNTFLYPDSEFPIKTLLQEKSKTLIVSHQKNPLSDKPKQSQSCTACAIKPEQLQNIHLRGQHFI